GSRPRLAPTPSADEPARGRDGGTEAIGAERASGVGVASPGDVASREGSSRGSVPPETAEPEPTLASDARTEPWTGCRWWVVADPRHEARLRRLLEGPPRAAEPGA